ncbi:unnamed protein product [Calicophoron daubneyi]|uniref:EF-hand domain-containing protein n=1 Tax=Calicophoron daubneyi TaxID=300641 RepID=A0AAV2T7U9_CALDB
MASQATQDQKLLYQEAFNSFDLNRDGEIDCEELEKALRKLGLEPTKGEVKAMIKQVDTDNSGTMNFMEFITMVEQKKKYQDTDENLRKSFKFFDKDGDGYITAVELKSVISKVNTNVTTKEIEEMIKKVDKNKDGRLDYDEFIVLMRGK